MPKANKRSSKKIGRNSRSPAHKRYIAEQRWLKNKARRMTRYMVYHPNWTPSEGTSDELVTLARSKVSKKRQEEVQAAKNKAHANKSIQKTQNLGEKAQ